MTAPTGHGGELSEVKDEWDQLIEDFRRRLEELLGNNE